MAIFSAGTFPMPKPTPGPFKHIKKVSFDNRHCRNQMCCLRGESDFSQKTLKFSHYMKFSLIPKYKVFWGKIEFWWPISQRVRSRCPNQPPSLLNTLKVFHLSIDNGVVRCVARAEIANLSKKTLKKVTSLVPAVGKILEKQLW